MNEGPADENMEPRSPDIEDDRQRSTRGAIDDVNLVVNFCRICQEDTEEAVIKLGCQCRGELAGAHQTCIARWFGGNATNKCEICLQIATTVPAYFAMTPVHDISNYLGTLHVQEMQDVLTSSSDGRADLDSEFKRPKLIKMIFMLIMFLAGLSAVTDFVMYSRISPVLSVIMAFSFVAFYVPAFILEMWKIYRYRRTQQNPRQISEEGGQSANV